MQKKSFFASSVPDSKREKSIIKEFCEISPVMWLLILFVPLI